MGKTVIESLAVELGLDPKQFTKGMKDAAKASKSTEDTVKKSTDSMAKGFASAARELIGLFLVFKGVQGVLRYFGQLNDNMRQLGINSRNLGTSARELKSLQNLSELFGGNPEDATKFEQALQKSVLDTFAPGGSGLAEHLKQFQLIGIQAYDPVTKKARNFKDVIFDTIEAFRRLREVGDVRGMNPAPALGNLGITGGLANFIVKGMDDPVGARRQYDEQERLNHDAAAQAKAAEQLGMAWDRLKQKMEGIARTILKDLTPALERLFKGAGDYLQRHQGDIEQGINSALEWFSGPGPGHVVDAMTAIADAALDAAKFIHVLANPIDSLGDGLKNLDQWAKDRNAATKAKGDLYARQNKIENESGLERGTLEKAGIDPNAPDAVQRKAAADVAAIYKNMTSRLGSVSEYVNRGGNQAIAAQRYRNQSLQKPPQPTPRATGAAASNVPTASTSSVTIGKIEVHTAATDANGIAASIHGALSRRLNVGLADTGLA